MPEFQEAIIQRLHQWRNPTLRDIEWTDDGVQAAILHQDRFGWYNLLMGRISVKWKEVQQRYYVLLGRRNTGRRWLISLIETIWAISWDMWDHRNGILHNTIIPAKQRRIDDLDWSLNTRWARKDYFAETFTVSPNLYNGSYSTTLRRKSNG
jgi:hypothetical protein